MISPNTPSGTEIICIDNDPNSCMVPNCLYARNNLDGLTKYKRYTVDYLIISPEAKSGISVVLRELSRPMHHDHEIGYDIARFKMAVLPPAITSLLSVKSPPLPTSLTDLFNSTEKDLKEALESV